MSKRFAADKFASLDFPQPALRSFPGYTGVFKRVLDIALALLLLPALVPVIATLAVLTRLDGAPAFFGHRRVGQGGRPFTCWKIRTMVPDAQQRLERLLAADPQAQQRWCNERKLAHDPRVTRFGAFLRKSSLDELPQIWNVLRGEMSLVGPRPVPEDELQAQYAGKKWVYQAVRPGVTGLWQVSGRNEVSYAERIALDMRYFETLSLRTDLVILLRTIAAVLTGTGR